MVLILAVSVLVIIPSQSGFGSDGYGGGLWIVVVDVAVDVGGGVIGLM